MGDHEAKVREFIRSTGEWAASIDEPSDAVVAGAYEALAAFEALVAQADDLAKTAKERIDGLELELEEYEEQAEAQREALERAQTGLNRVLICEDLGEAKEVAAIAGNESYELLRRRARSSA